MRSRRAFSIANSVQAKLHHWRPQQLTSFQRSAACQGLASRRPRRVIVYNHVTEVLLIYSAKTYSDGPFRKIRVYLISRFFSIRENRENFMLTKYTWFTVGLVSLLSVIALSCHIHVSAAVWLFILCFQICKLNL